MAEGSWLGGDRLPGQPGPSPRGETTRGRILGWHASRKARPGLDLRGSSRPHTDIQDPTEPGLQDVLVGRNVPEALPLVCLQGQPLEGLHAAVDTQPVADEHVHDPLGAGADGRQVPVGPA